MKACFSPWTLLRPGLSILAAAFALMSFAQGGNPFDLTPRLASPPQEDTAVIADTGNPFDLLAPAAGGGQIKVPDAAQGPALQKKRESQPEMSNWRTLLVTTIGSMLVFTILLTLFRPQFARAYRAFQNDNMLSQLQREREGGGGLPYYLFYALFMVNAGLFLYLISRYFGFPVHPNSWVALGYCAAAVVALFLGKHLLLGILSYIFPIDKEVRLYNFTIIIFSIMLGVFFMAANMLIAYSPEHFTKYIIYVSFAFIAALYLFRALRGLFIGNRFLAFNKFHFLLYICTVEIAPVLVLARLIAG